MTFSYPVQYIILDQYECLRIICWRERVVIWERSQRSEKEEKCITLKDITGYSDKTVRRDEAQRKCCVFIVYWEKAPIKCMDWWSFVDC